MEEKCYSCEEKCNVACCIAMLVATNPQCYDVTPANSNREFLLVDPSGCIVAKVISEDDAIQVAWNHALEAIPTSFRELCSLYGDEIKLQGVSADNFNDVIEEVRNLVIMQVRSDVCGAWIGAESEIYSYDDDPVTEIMERLGLFVEG